jgi:dihydroorotate dehydrogenase
MYKLLIRPILFCLDPEKAHHFTVKILRLAFAIPGVPALIKTLFKSNPPANPVRLMGLDFPNPVGIAAGFDKDAGLFRELSAFGFGFIEIGTVTPLPQPGNPKPRMFRLPADKGLINRMGFNNEGVKAAAARLKNRPQGLIIGGNIGRNKVTSNENAENDYVICFEELFPVVDYFVVNVSSPNTPGLRELQEKEPLTRLLKRIMQVNQSRAAPKPVLLKIAPDLSDPQLDEIIGIVTDCGLQGIIATNTTISRSGLKTKTEEAGGLSGAPLRQRSTDVIRYLRQHSQKDLVLIGAGGIFSGEDALEKINAGADLVQVYTGFIYEGPSMVKRILKFLRKANPDGKQA